METRVVFNRQAQKQLRKAPEQVASKLKAWSLAVARDGLTEVSLIPGYHDEPLKGQRQGQRSIRLNLQWRALYSVEADGTITLVTIEEVTPHDYRTR
jgi:toxin HigB-1